MSLRNSNGDNIFALPKSETNKARGNAAFDDTKYLSEVAEQFLAGILDGIADGQLPFFLVSIN